MRSSSIEVVLLKFSSNFDVRYFSGWVGVGGWVESRIRLISAETEAEALLGLAELGKISVSYNKISDFFLRLPWPIKSCEWEVTREFKLFFSQTFEFIIDLKSQKLGHSDN